jgi:hypothetical protein
MTSILRKLSLASAIVAAAAFAAAPALAETSLTVPFSFVAGGKLCPAGHYSIDRNPLSGIVTLRGSSRSFGWVTGPGDALPTDTRVILKFDARDNVFYLNSVQYGPAVTQRLDKKSPEYVPSRRIEGE